MLYQKIFTESIIWQKVFISCKKEEKEEKSIMTGIIKTIIIGSPDEYNFGMDLIIKLSEEYFFLKETSSKLYERNLILPSLQVKKMNKKLSKSSYPVARRQMSETILILSIFIMYEMVQKPFKFIKKAVESDASTALTKTYFKDRNLRSFLFYYNFKQKNLKSAIRSSY